MHANLFKIVTSGLVALGLSGCQAGLGSLGLDRTGNETIQPIEPQSPQKVGSAVGEVLGFGPTRVALLLPKTVPGHGAVVANQIRNAAQMAIEDLGAGVMELVVKDTLGTSTGSLSATQQALAEGAAVVLGPVFSSSVTSARSVIAQTNRPLIGFSSDPSSAGPGSYLISFLPDQLIKESVEYATQQGKRTFVAVLPTGSYGILAERQLRQSILNTNGALLGITRYEYENESVKTAVNDIAEAAKQADVIFIPDGGASPLVIARGLRAKGVDLSTKMLMGTGQWRSSQLNAPDLQGAIFADMDTSRFEQFKLRYSAKFGSEPTVNAALGYDAVLLVGGFLKTNPNAAITKANIERSQGFVGASGIFRFLPNGQNQHGLAIYKVDNGNTVIVRPAPQSFNNINVN